MASLTDVAGVGPIFTRNGEQFQCALIQPQHRAMFQAWLIKQAWEAIELSKQWASADTIGVAISRLTQDIAAKRYSQSSENYRTASRDPEGIRYLLLCMVRSVKGQEWITEEWVAKWTDEQPEAAMLIYRQAIGDPTLNTEKNEGGKEEPESEDSKSGKPAG